jgi:hypothetical protein
MNGGIGSEVGLNDRLPPQASVKLESEVRDALLRY